MARQRLVDGGGGLRVLLLAGPVAAGRGRGGGQPSARSGRSFRWAYRDKRGVEYDAVPLPTHEVADAVRADLPTTKPKRRPMTAAARAAFGKRMKACWVKRKRARR